jgi:hypothetical protein
MNGWEAGTRTPIRRSRVYLKCQKSQQIKDLALQTAEESGRTRKTAARQMPMVQRRPRCLERSVPGWWLVSRYVVTEQGGNALKSSDEYAPVEIQRAELGDLLICSSLAPPYIVDFPEGDRVGARRGAASSALIALDSAHNERRRGWTVSAAR